MNLQELLGDTVYPINIPSARNNKDNKLGITFGHLYNYFYNYNGQSYHTLVEPKGIEEYYLFMNDQDLLLIALSEYMIDCKIEDNLLTIYVYLFDNKDSPLEVPFIYDLNDLDSLYELNKLLGQDKIDIFFTELINDVLIIQSSFEMMLPKDFKDYLNSKINKYINENYNNISELSAEHEKQVVELDEIINDKGSIDRDFKKYNWVDVKEFAKKIFWNYGFEMPWAEDAWNILMFNDAVRSDNIVSAKHNDYECGDIILWLVALNDIYFKYKVAADYEPIDESDLLEYMSRLNSYEKYIGSYLKKGIFQEFNKTLVEGKILEDELNNIKSSKFEFINDITGTSIEFEVLYREIENRKELFKQIMWNYFEKNDILISFFMQGQHWCDNYFDLDKKIKKIEEKYDKILSEIKKGKVIKYYIGNKTFKYKDAEDVEYDRKSELEELEQEYNSKMSDAQNIGVYSWIGNGMVL